jgi:hypothetical protein
MRILLMHSLQSHRDARVPGLQGAFSTNSSFLCCGGFKRSSMVKLLLPQANMCLIPITRSSFSVAASGTLNQSGTRRYAFIRYAPCHLPSVHLTRSISTDVRHRQRCQSYEKNSD